MIKIFKKKIYTKKKKKKNNQETNYKNKKIINIINLQCNFANTFTSLLWRLWQDSNLHPCVTNNTALSPI